MIAGKTWFVSFILIGIFGAFTFLVPGRFIVADDYPEIIPAGAPPENKPLISLTPREGLRGDFIRINGKSFSKQTVVKFYFSATAGSPSSTINGDITIYKFLGSVWTDSGGFINNETQPAGNQAVFPVPYWLDDGSSVKNTPGGTCFILATYHNSSAVLVSAAFKVTTLASITVAPETGFVGELVSITGHNLGKNEILNVKIDDRDLHLAGTQRTTIAGEYQGKFTLPDSTDGRHTVYLTDETGNVAGASFTTLTKLVLNTTSQGAGGEMTLIGTGFAGLKPVTISLKGKEIKPVEEPVITSVFGRFRATIELPIDIDFVKGAKVPISAVAGTSAAGTEFDLINPAPSLTFMPELDAATKAYVGMEMTVNGHWFSAGETVSISIDNPRISLGMVVVDRGGFFTIGIVLPAITSGQHQIIASGVSETVKREFEMEQEAPPAPVPIASRTDTVTAPGIDVAWAPVSDPSGITYDIQIAFAPDFRNLLVEKSGLTVPEFVSSPGEMDNLFNDGDSLFWRVRAVDGVGNASDWMPPSSFFMESTGTLLPVWAYYLVVVAGLIAIGGVLVYLRKRRASFHGSGSLN